MNSTPSDPPPSPQLPDVPDVTDEPVRGTVADINVLAYPGIEQARALRDQRLALPPNARLPAGPPSRP